MLSIFYFFFFNIMKAVYLTGKAQMRLMPELPLLQCSVRTGGSHVHLNFCDLVDEIIHIKTGQE